PVPIGPSLRFPSIATAEASGSVKYFFVDDPDFFHRDQLYGAGGLDYPDNGLRFAEFVYAAIEMCRHAWMPDVIHCHDWQSGLLPVLTRTKYTTDPRFHRAPIVFTI